MKACCIFSLLALSLLSCTNTENNEIVVSDIKMANSNTKASSLLEDYSYVLLDSIAEGKYLRQIQKVSVDSTIIFVKERYDISIGGLYLFDRDGKYLRQLNYSEEGTNPLRSIHDFTIDSKLNLIYVLDAVQKEIFIYDYDLNLQDRITLEQDVYALEYVKDNFVLATLVGEKYILTTDKKGNLKSEYLTADDKQRVHQFTTFSKYDDKIYYNPPYDNNIYVITADREPSVDIRLKFVEEISNDKSSIHSVNVTDNLAVFSYQQPEGAVVLIKDMLSKKVIKYSEINDDISHMKFFLLPIVGTTASDFIYFASPEWLKSNTRNLPKAEINIELQGVLSRLDDNSNPVLVFANIKNTF